MEGLFTLLLYAGFFYLMMRFGCGTHMIHGHGRHGSSEEGGHSQHAPAASRSIDPVCGVEVAPGMGYTKMYAGREYRLCSRACLDTFDARPQQYAA